MQDSSLSVVTNKMMELTQLPAIVLFYKGKPVSPEFTPRQLQIINGARLQAESPRIMPLMDTIEEKQIEEPVSIPSGLLIKVRFSDGTEKKYRIQPVRFFISFCNFASPLFFF